MLTNLDARLSPHAPVVLSLFRVVFALLFLCHATSHLFGWPVATDGTAMWTRVRIVECWPC